MTAIQASGTVTQSGGLSYLVATVVCSGGLTALLTGALRRYALRTRRLDRPNERSSHSIPTPRGGGAAIITVGASGITIGAIVGVVGLRTAAVMAFGMVALGCVGWIDDGTSVRPGIRFFIQVAVSAVGVIALGGLPDLRTGVGHFPLGVAGYPIAILGIVWCINLFNFMDGIDGLAGSQAALIFCAISVFSFAADIRSLGLIAAILAGSSAGFLAWNWPPARIFMGDVGSGALGYAAAIIAVASENSRGTPLLVFCLIGGVFLIDATVTLLRRLYRGHDPTQAHRDHAYQRMTREWQSHRRVTLAACGLTVGLCALGGLAVIWPALLLPALGLGWGSLALTLVFIERRTPMFR